MLVPWRPHCDRLLRLRGVTLFIVNLRYPTVGRNGRGTPFINVGGVNLRAQRPCGILLDAQASLDSVAFLILRCTQFNRHAAMDTLIQIPHFEFAATLPLTNWNLPSYFCCLIAK